MTSRIPKVSIHKNELETSINIDPISKTATVYSCVPSMVNKLYAFAENGNARIVRDDKYGLAVEVPSNWIKISKPRTLNLNDEQRKERAMRLAMGRLKQDKAGVGYDTSAD